MILGTRNFTQEYNGTYVESEECYKILDKFYEMGGEIIDTAYNYESKNIIKQWVLSNHLKDIKIQTKIENRIEFKSEIKFWEEIKIYSVLARKNNNKLTIMLENNKKNNIIEKWGLSLYLPQELSNNSYCNILQIPFDRCWFDYINIINLYADIQFRSFYNLYKYDFIENKYEIKRLDKYNKDKKIEYVIGVDNVKQLKENMELFK